MRSRPRWIAAASFSCVGSRVIVHERTAFPSLSRRARIRPSGAAAYTSEPCTAGEVAAGRTAEGGLEVALVERELIGGECSFYACMPSKALLRPGDLADEIGRVPG